MNSGPLRRLVFLGSFLGIVFVALGARLVQLQVVDHEKWATIKGANTERSYLREPHRGDIVDINGNPLATSLQVKRVLADPSLVGDHWAEVARVVAPLISYDEPTLAQLLKPTTFTNAQGEVKIRSYVDLHRKVNFDTWQQVTQAMSRLTFGIDESTLPRSKRQFYQLLRQSTIYAKDAQLRFYPNKNLASHVVGYTQEHEQFFNKTAVFDLAGVYGIEKEFEKQLSGSVGWRLTERDNRNREITVFREQDLEARPGLSVVLTIDVVIQNIVEQQLVEAMRKYNPQSVQCVVSRPQTGEILAMATLPNFDPNAPGANMDHLRNRVIADMIEPGSTFKVVAVSGALNEGLVTLNDTFDCEHGNWFYAGKILHDTHGGHGTLSVEDIIAKSSNIGTAKIAIYKLEKERLYKYIRAFGFGTKTGIPLLGEVGGWVHPLPYWEKDKVLISRVPIGQSITVTPLQLIMAYGAIANGGRLMRPMLVNRLKDSTGEVFAQYHPEVVRQVISEQASRQIITAMKKVVTKDGTAAKAALEHYNVAGKTGTAWKTEENKGYVRGKYVASFVGFFPADEPEVCIAVVLDEPDPKIAYYGGQTTAPIFQKIAEEVASYLQLKPDRIIPSPETMAGGRADGRLNTVASRRN